MRMLRPVIVAAALGAALLDGGLPAHASWAAAEHLPSVSLSPDFAEPRETISVLVTCRHANIRKSVVISGAFDPVTLVASGAHESILSGTTVIRDVRPGRYRVTSTCDDQSSAATTLTILAPGSPHVAPESPAHPVPRGGARTGGGGMAPNRPPAGAAGGALLALGLGLVAITLRRRIARH